jgi:GNAT superfamily N-acetyltransferase
MLARAFFDDPVSTWSCPPDGLRGPMLERFFFLRLQQVARKGEVWVAGEGRSAALWHGPEQWRTTVKEDLELATVQLHPRLVWRLPLVAWGLLGIERAHPHRPSHWYLSVLGTEPAEQGKRLGSAALRPVLERCDRDGIDAYLESSKEANIPFYARHGFRVVDKLKLPWGPEVYPMWRYPR